MTSSLPPTSAPASAPVDRAPAPGARFERVGGGLSLVASGALALAGLLLTTPLAPAGSAGVADVALHYGVLLVLPASLALVHLARRRARRLAVAATVLSVLGAGASGSSLVRDDGAALLAARSPSDLLVGAPAVTGLALGVVLAAAAAWRAGKVPGLPVLLNALGWGVLALGGEQTSTAVLGTALITAGLTWLGVRVLRLSDRLWSAL